MKSFADYIDAVKAQNENVDTRFNTQVTPYILYMLYWEWASKQFDAKDDDQSNHDLFINCLVQCKIIFEYHTMISNDKSILGINPKNKDTIPKVSDDIDNNTLIYQQRFEKNESIKKWHTMMTDKMYANVAHTLNITVKKNQTTHMKKSLALLMVAFLLLIPIRFKYLPVETFALPIALVLLAIATIIAIPEKRTIKGGIAVVDMQENVSQHAAKQLFYYDAKKQVFDTKHSAVVKFSKNNIKHNNNPLSEGLQKEAKTLMGTSSDADTFVAQGTLLYLTRGTNGRLYSNYDAYKNVKVGQFIKTPSIRS